jgi:hypothetical protein
MKSVLRFDLPEERIEFLNAVHGQDYAVACWELDSKLRGWLKHGGHDFTTPEQVMEEIRRLLREELEDKGVPADLWSG